LVEFLYRFGLSAVSIHGDKQQSERERALEQFKSGVRPILVATDVAARGLDINNIANVINYDTPNHIDDYVHRIGRTGRAGKQGKAISFINEKNNPVIKNLIGLLTESGQTVPEWFMKMYKDTLNKNFNGNRKYYGGR